MLFFLNDPATAEIYTLSLHDALPISACGVSALTAIPWPSHSLAALTVSRLSAAFAAPYTKPPFAGLFVGNGGPGGSSRSEEHTSELQSRLHLVCRLLLEKKKLAALHS